MKTIEEAILTYTSAWNETAPERIKALIDRCWAEEGIYTDRLTDTITGREGIAALITRSYEQMGPRTFQVLGAPETHHYSGRFRWLASFPQGYPAEGMDYFEFNADNRITRIVGFF